VNKIKILITGGCGFIGSNFIHYLINNSDCDIVNYDKLTYAGNLNNLKSIENNKRCVFIKGDIIDFNLLDNVIKKHKIDTIVNFAAESHVDNSIVNPNIFIKTNILGTQALLNIARKYNLRFHHISTDEVFGELGKDDPPFNEFTPYDPRSPYSASKAASDHLVRAYINTYGLKATISNCSNNYGPYQYPEKVMPLFITNLIDGKKVGVYGDGQNIRDWLHTEDHCRAIKLVLEEGKIGETYCIGGGCEKTNLEVTKTILKEMGHGEEMMEFIPDRPGHDFRYAIDFSKIKNELGWKPQIDFNEGIKDKIKWYKENEWWWRKLKK
jgi:dTDP-glucose 4,6-dehydratase